MRVNIVMETVTISNCVWKTRFENLSTDSKLKFCDLELCFKLLFAVAVG